MLFQHIPVYQEFDGLKKVSEGTPGALKDSQGNYYILNEEYCESGVMGELPSPPENKDRTQFDLWKKHGDIVAAVFGHDHVNNFIMNIDGIKLIQTFGAGYHTYGEKGGSRLIILNENDPWNFETESYQIPRITTTKL